MIIGDLKNTEKKDGKNDADVLIENATKAPILFAQVREDPLVDEAVISRYFAATREISVAMVASGGDTAAYLLKDRRIRKLDLVDVSKAQLSLSKLKIGLLSERRERRLALLGHSAMDRCARRKAMEKTMARLCVDAKVFGETDVGLGVDNVGRYEMMFEGVRRNLQDYRDEIERLFSLSSVDEQASSIASETALGRALDTAFSKTMSLDNLVRVFGEKAVGNHIQEFWMHFVERIRAYMTENLVSQSPFVAQILLGRFCKGMCYPWHDLPQISPQADIAFHEMEMTEYLKTAQGLSIVHLSNITDWLAYDEMVELLMLASNALGPGGVVVVRQLNTGFDLCSVRCGLFWDEEASEELQRIDRSLLYRRIVVGRKIETSLVSMHSARLAEDVLRRHPVTDAAFFRDIASKKVSHRAFVDMQSQFFHAVDYFWRPMSVLMSRLRSYDHRHALLQNVIEEHGEGRAEEAHTETFKLFLARLGHAVPTSRAPPGVLAFNTSLMGVSVGEDLYTALGCFGLIEYAFSEISSLVGGYVAEMGWLPPDDIVHYSLHAELDKEHAQGLFSTAEAVLYDKRRLASFKDGLCLGAHIFRALYDAIYDSTK